MGILANVGHIQRIKSALIYSSNFIQPDCPDYFLSSGLRCYMSPLKTRVPAVKKKKPRFTRKHKVLYALYIISALKCFLIPYQTRRVRATEERRKNKKKRNKHTPFQMRLHSNSLSQPIHSALNIHILLEQQRTRAFSPPSCKIYMGRENGWK